MPFVGMPFAPLQIMDAPFVEILLVLADQKPRRFPLAKPGLLSRSPKAGHPKAGRSDFRNQRFETDTEKTRKMRKVPLTQKNKGLRRFRRAKILEILENLEILEILENPRTVENQGESDHFLEILENPPVKRPLS